MARPIIPVAVRRIAEGVEAEVCSAGGVWFPIHSYFADDESRKSKLWEACKASGHKFPMPKTEFLWVIDRNAPAPAPAPVRPTNPILDMPDDDDMMDLPDVDGTDMPPAPDQPRSPQPQPAPQPQPQPQPNLAKASESELSNFGFTLTRLPSAAKKEKEKKAKTLIVWPVDVARVASAMSVELPVEAPAKGASEPGTLTASPSKEARAAFSGKPVRLPSQLDRIDAGPVWALWVANGGRFDAAQAPQFASMAAGESLPLVTLLSTLNPAELSGKAFGLLWTGAGSQGILRTIAQYSGRSVTLSLNDFTITMA